MSEVWLTVCKEDDLVEGSGICTLLNVDGKDEQVALFKFDDTKCYALSNYDPFGEANVLSRGIVGSIGDKIVVASPLYKQHFCLESGQCLEDETVSIPFWQVRIDDGNVQLKTA